MVPRKEIMDAMNRILIVDDDATVRVSYRQVLSRREKPYLSQGDRLFGGGKAKTEETSPLYDIREAKNGGEAVGMVREAVERGRPFELAFVDMKMPGMNGAETAREIWRIDSGIKIVIVTAFSEVSPDEMVQVTAREDLFYLRKPFNPEEIRQFARALCRQRDLERERDLLAAGLGEANLALEDMNRNLAEKVRKQAEMLIQSEKMASLGVLVAGVAHEINNPLSFIKANLSALKQYAGSLAALIEKYEALTATLTTGKGNDPAGRHGDIQDFRERKKIDVILGDLPDLLTQSLEGTERIEAIVRDLRGFSRADEGERRDADINESIDTAINIIWNEVKGRVKIVRDYGDLPAVSCFPQKLIQAVMNILINASHAVTDMGDIRIVTRQVKASTETTGSVRIEISDTGCGMSEKDVKRVFDPFFTTKPVGRGLGLGLYITYEIIHAHGGDISVDSREGAGSTFTITLPMAAGAIRPLIEV